MSFIFTGDLHIDKDNIRISAALNYIQYLKNYCLEHNINTIFFGGDVFNHCNNIKASCFLVITEAFYNLSQEGFKLYFLVGNHEMINNSGDNLLTLFKGFATVVEKPGTISIDGFNYDVLNYSENTEDLPKNSSVLLTHLPVRTFVYESGQEDKNSPWEPDMFESYSTVLSGHLHTKQEREQFCFVGSPYPTNRGEKQKINYFAVVDKDVYNLEIYNEGPDYITISAEALEKNGFDKYDFTNKIVDLELSRKVENIVKLRNILYSKGAIEIYPLFTPGEEKIINLSSDININEGITKSTVKFLKQQKQDGIDETKLLKCFKNILENLKKD